MRLAAPIMGRLGLVCSVSPTVSLNHGSWSAKKSDISSPSISRRANIAPEVTLTTTGAVCRFLSVAMERNISLLSMAF